ncbi:hypothetical protein MPTK1_8g03380 [Marchantia polymorpha subsp. ruderalis]|uniref:Uncharacterized protein n=1 Tax=Marchantia polymorpha TaxID=3197 RepID=A0A2R6XJE1_MARPO|nr:hypothetical protein MARPO_0012s0129 [Marchantia polymorpha]BBN18552.1 hypothetical protein Mp_8g03380 [Marchantia polymorpha subsp. ruderalis]|eukprot:PTQ46199.1 hypothetical protein MARPO_0012s0129 [Marchantia polymorpha]
MRSAKNYIFDVTVERPPKPPLFLSAAQRYCIQDLWIIQPFQQLLARHSRLSAMTTPNYVAAALRRSALGFDG